MNSTPQNAKPINPLQSIEQMHATWAAMCVPDHAGPAQREDMKRSFYCGVVAMISAFGGLSELPEAIAQDQYEKWTLELELYKMDMAIMAAADSQ